MRPAASILAAMLLACPLVAAPPDVPKTLPARVGELVVLEVKGKGIGYQPTFAPTDVFFARLHTDDPDALTFVVQVKASRRPGVPLAVVFWTVGEGKGATCVLDTGGSGPPVDPPIDPPIKPPVAGPRFFAVVRADGPASPAVSRMLALPEWDSLRGKGHRVKDYTLSQTAALGITVPDGTTLPCVVVYGTTADGLNAVLRPAAPAPATGADVLKLAE